MLKHNGSRTNSKRPRQKADVAHLAARVKRFAKKYHAHKEIRRLRKGICFGSLQTKDPRNAIRRYFCNPFILLFKARKLLVNVRKKILLMIGVKKRSRSTEESRTRKCGERHVRGIKVERIAAFILMCDLAAMLSKRPTAKACEKNDEAPESNSESKNKNPNKVERHL